MSDITIITPSLNSADVIADCIQCVSKQTFSVQHLVVDGRSADSTLEVIREIAADVQLIEEPPSGIYAAINSGIRAANGDIVGILHADDFYPSEHVLQQVCALFENPAVDACYGDLCYVDRSNPERVVRYWRSGEFAAGRFLNGWMPPHPALFVRRKTYERCGLYRTDFGSAADYELMVRFFVKHRLQAVYLPEVLVHMRTGGASNASWRARIAANRMDSRAWRVNGLRRYPWTTVVKPLRKIGQWWRKPQG